MIVSRGLGKGVAGALVAAGLCLSVAIVVVPPFIAPEASTTIFGYSGQVGKVVPIQRTKVSLTLPSVTVTSLFSDIEAKGAANVTLLGLTVEFFTESFRVSGAASASTIGISSETLLGKLLVKGEHDLSDEEVLCMILALIV